MSAQWTELPVVVEGRWALAQALRQWKYYADEISRFDHPHALGSGKELEDKLYVSAAKAAEGLEAAADELAKAPVVEQDRVRVQRMDRLCARWQADAEAMDDIASEEDDDETILALECRERSRTLRDCITALKAEWAGTEPIDKLCDLRKEAPDVR